MPDKLYRFHCTNGRETVFDHVGKRLSSDSVAMRHARHVAGRMMRAERALAHWTGWHVEIYTEGGSCLWRLSFVRL